MGPFLSCSKQYVAHSSSRYIVYTQQLLVYGHKENFIGQDSLLLLIALIVIYFFCLLVGMSLLLILPACLRYALIIIDR